MPKLSRKPCSVMHFSAVERKGQFLGCFFNGSGSQVLNPCKAAQEPASLRGTKCLESFFPIKTETPQPPLSQPLNTCRSSRGGGEEVRETQWGGPGLVSTPFPHDPAHLTSLSYKAPTVLSAHPSPTAPLPHTHALFKGRDAKSHYSLSPWYCHEGCLVCLPEK